MKIFTSYLAHETNSFSPIPTGLMSFEELEIFRPSYGLEMTPTLIKGASNFYNEALRRKDEVFVGLCAHSQPSRPCSRATYEMLRDWLLEDLKSAGPVDVVLVMLHGSMMAEGYDDCEGDLLVHIRALVGPDVPIGALLDLHCNITQTMRDEATFLIACKEYPHTDFEERALELYELCAQTRAGKIKPSQAHVQIPILGLYQTAKEPMRSFVDSIISAEKKNGMLAICLGHGFPWADFHDAGASIIVYTDGDTELAEAHAQRLASQFYDLREIGQAQLASVKTAVDEALEIEAGTAIIADMADNPGGGAASDSTFILQELVSRGAKDVLLAYFWDPTALDLAFAAGLGARLPLRVGGKVGHFSGSPVDLDAEILCLRDDACQPHIADGAATPLGRTALIRAKGIEIILNDVRQQPFSPKGLEEAGAEPWSKRIVVVKSSHHFYAGFHEQAARIIYCDAPGTLNSDVFARPYAHLRRPIWPLDEIPFTGHSKFSSVK